MKKTSRVFLALTMAALFAATLFCATGAIAQDKATPAAKKPTAHREKAGTVTATIQAIDLEKRIVTVKGGPKDQVIELKAGEKVKNLSKLKVGDVVVVKYYASLAVRMAKPGEAESVATSEVKKAGSQARQVTVTATVQDIDKNTNIVFLKGPEGNIVGVKAEDPKRLDELKAGDQIVVTYTEALAISIEKAKKK
jgi:hypothetical protein